MQLAVVSKILWAIFISLCSGALYFAGGQINKLFRRVGVAVAGLIEFVALGGGLEANLSYFLAYILTFGFSYIALGSYWDFLTRLWRKNENEYFENWLLTGAGYGFAYLPMVLIGIHWQAIVARAIVLALSIMWLRERTGKVFIEEFFSGFLYAGSIPIMIF